MKQLLVPIDFSKVSTKVTQQAARLAETFRANLWLLHVAAPEPEFIGFEPGPDSVRDQVARRFRAEHRKLQRRASQLRRKGLKVEALLVQGPTVSTILKEIRRLKIDLVVIGSHGHGALRRALVGSVSEGVIRKAPCPVLLIPAGKR